MTTHIEKQRHGYHNFFRRTLPEIAFCPVITTYTRIEENMDQGTGSDGEGWGRAASAACSTCKLLPLLFIPTVITMFASLVFAIAAGIVAPFVFTGAAIADCASPTPMARQRA